LTHYRPDPSNSPLDFRVADQQANLFGTCFKGADRRQSDRGLGDFDPKERRGAPDDVTAAGDPDWAGVGRDQGVAIDDQPQPRRGMAFHRHAGSSLHQRFDEAKRHARGRATKGRHRA
jgi:hypothetical protein